MSPAKRRKILKVVARLPPSGLGSAALPAALADRWAVGGGLWERGISSVRPSVGNSQSLVRATCTGPHAGSDCSDCGNCSAAAPSPAQGRVSLPTAHFRRGSRPPRMRGCQVQQARYENSSPARGAPRWPPPGPARVHRRLSESRAVPTAQGALAGGLRHHNQASVLRTVTYLKSGRFATPLKRVEK